MTRTSPLYILIVALLFAARSSHAQQLEITFEFDTSSTVSAYGGQVQVPPQGMINSASAVLIVPAAGPIYALPGATVLQNSNFDLSVDALSLGANVVGALSANQQGTTTGTLAADLEEITLTGPLMMDALGDLDCGGNAQMCAMLGSFSLVVNGVETVPAGNELMLRNVNVDGQAELEGSLLLSISGPSSDTIAVIHLHGRESSRTYVPEPAVLPSLAAGTATLWLLSRRRRRAAR
jgi:hypothetical protein